ncbi:MULTISPECIES: cell division protein FtsQ/DivIB [unclassified Pseudoalteromonas]|uniref:cell division protein FtsQ/DivIB n=1 Tax=unclassified Pseudoalteromonas TaxID=194690 RepID=UPI003014F2CE
MRAFLAKTKHLSGKVNWPLFWGLSFFFVVVFSLVKGTFWVSDWLVEHHDAQIKTLKVLGKPHYTAEHDIVTAIKTADLNSFFELDVKAVHQAVLALPWVASVSVRKQWPDTLQVYVVEHTPVAHWNSDLLLNEAGEVFQARSNKLPEGLPELYGPEGSAEEAWQAFQQFKALLAVNQFTLDSLALSERFAWQLWLDNGIRLNLGREDKAQRVQRFIDVYPRMDRPEGKVVDVVDLRYDTGLAVSWKAAPEQQQQQNNKSEA